MMGDAKSSRRTVFQSYKILLIKVVNIDHFFAHRPGIAAPQLLYPKPAAAERLYPYKKAALRRVGYGT
jgi:hypothetical protein